MIDMSKLPESLPACPECGARPLGWYTSRNGSVYQECLRGHYTGKRYWIDEIMAVFDAIRAKGSPGMEAK
jgi:hypothetical protein